MIRVGTVGFHEDQFLYFIFVFVKISLDQPFKDAEFLIHSIVSRVLTALTIARYYRYADIEKLLTQAGAHIDFTDTFDAAYLDFLMRNQNIPFGVKESVKRAAAHNFQGYILEFYDPFDSSFDEVNDEDSTYYVYCENVKTVVKSLDEFATHIYEVKDLIKISNSSYFYCKTEIRKWLADNHIK